MWLVGDIGGTHTRIAVFPQRGNTPIYQSRVKSRDYKSFELALKAALDGTKFRLRAACFGIAGPVFDNRCVTTNLPWVLEGDKLARRLQIPRVRLVNDLVAMAYGAMNAPRSQCVAINGSKLPKPKGSNIAILAAGTGLGEGALIWDDLTQRHTPLATEGSHSDFAAQKTVDDELRVFLSRKYGRVSTERVVSGPALEVLYEFFRDIKHLPEQEARNPNLDFSAEVTRLGLEEKNDCATAAVDLFVRCYGAEAGNVALRYMARGGVYLGGNISSVLRKKIQSPLFRQAFTNKGRFSEFLQSVPVALITNSDIGLLGALFLARGKTR